MAHIQALVAEPTGTGTKRARTRARLLNSAVGIFADKGIDNTTILEITRSAGVANGTFYTHFRDKDELLASVGELLVQHVLDEMHETIDSIDHVPTKIAAGAQWILDRAARNPEVGSIMAQRLAAEGAFQTQSLLRIRGDIVAGAAAGQLAVDDVDRASAFVNSVTMSALWMVIAGEEPEPVQLLAAETHLRMLGIPVAEARAFARRAHELLSAGTGGRRDRRDAEVGGDGPPHRGVRGGVG